MKTNYKFFLRNIVAKSGYLILLLIIFTANFGGNILNAQVSAYSFSQTNGAYSSVNGATVLGTATANSGAIPSLDSTSFPVTMPFGFVFNGQTYTDFNMSSNGYIAFGTVVASGSTPISATTTYDGAISAWGRDINGVFDIVGKTGNMSFAIEGTAPNRVAVMQWENFRPTYTTTTTSAYVFSFQIRLAETTNVISTVYSDGAYLIGSTAYSATNTQIGLRGATNADFNNRTNAGTVDFTSSTAGTANANGQSFSTTLSPPGMPTPGLTYTWTPPTCIVPADITISNITSTSATVNWTASVSAPTNGYDVFVSTSNIPPTATSTPTVPGVTQTTITLTGLTPSTQYFVWVRTNCGAGDFSNWSNLKLFNSACQPPAITGTTGATICLNSTATLTATADAGATIHWYDAGGTEVATGPSYTTPSLAATTTYYTSASVGTSNVPVGKTSYSAGPSSGAGTTNFGLVFDVFSPCILSSLTIYPVSATGAAGVVVIDVIDENGNILNTHSENVVGAPVGAPVPHIVNVNFALIPGNNYKLRHSSHAGISGLLFDPSATAPGGNYGYPFNLAGVLSINTSTLTAAPTNTVRNDLYYYFYDWKISSKCESAQQPVVATVDPACLGTSEIEGKNQLSIYPNPFKDVIYISDVKDVFSINILDVTGRLIKTVKPSKEINLSELKSGMYLINLRMKDGTLQTVKAIKK